MKVGQSTVVTGTVYIISPDIHGDTVTVVNKYSGYWGSIYFYRPFRKGKERKNSKVGQSTVVIGTVFFYIVQVSTVM